MKVLLLCLVLLTGCATRSLPYTDQTHHVLRIKTCLAEVAHIDPGPINNIADAQLEQALNTYADEFAKTDVMAMGLDPKSHQVRNAAFKALVYHCWRQGKLPPGDPLATVDPASKGYK